MDHKTIIISPENFYKTNNGIFEGWGTSLCWWANRIGYSDKLSQMAADLMFSPEKLGLNIMRYNIGGGDDPTHRHITRTDSMIPGWLNYNAETDEYTYDYDADKRQLNVLQRCVNAAGDDAYVEVFSNSPPYFWTHSGCSSGNVDASKDNLKPECCKQFSDYLAHVTEYINNRLGIKVKSLAPINEPNTSNWGAFSRKQEGCHVDAGESQSNIICDCYDALRKYGLDDVIISASDEMSTASQELAYKSYTERALECIGRVSTHSYDVNGIESLGELAEKEGFNFWMSEVDGGGVAGENAGEMSAALWLAKKIIFDMNRLKPSAWVLWQVIDSHICAAGFMGNQDRCTPDVTRGYWGLAICNHDEEEIILTQKYYAMGQFSRYIRPGDKIIHCGDDSFLAAYNEESGNVTVVAVNSTAKSQAIYFDLANFGEFSGVSAFRTSGDSKFGEKWSKIDCSTVSRFVQSIGACLKPNSITTFIFEK